MRKNQNKGYVLISVVVIIMVLVAMMYFFSDALFSELTITRNQKSATEGFHLAEAGVQEAVWRIQNDTTTRNTFLNTTNGLTTFTHPTAFLSGGSYNVSIQNTDKAVATITATGYLQVGLKTAQRKITTNVYQATADGPYTENGALFVGGPNSGNIYLHNLTVTYGAGYDPASIESGGNINIGNANISLSKDLLANKTITSKNSTISLPPPVPPLDPGGIQQSNYPGAFNLPTVSTDLYKTQAQAQGQYYTSAQFATLIKTKTTFNGVVYVGGTGGVTVKNKNLTINGVLVSEGSVDITNANIDINHSPGPSGLITLGNFSSTNANINIEGLLYVGIAASASVNCNITITGAILAHDFSANNITLKLNFKKDWVNETIQGGSNNPPVIKMQHWEEEY